MTFPCLVLCGENRRKTLDYTYLFFYNVMDYGNYYPA